MTLASRDPAVLGIVKWSPVVRIVAKIHGNRLMMNQRVSSLAPQTTYDSFMSCYWAISIFLNDIIEG